jgi:hypothetical protein
MWRIHAHEAARTPSFARRTTISHSCVRPLEGIARLLTIHTEYNFLRQAYMNMVSNFEQHLIAAREPWRVRSWHLASVLDFVDWANDTLAASGGWETLMAEDRYVLETCRERYLSEAIADRDLRGEERLRLNRFIRFVEASLRKETAAVGSRLQTATPAASGIGTVAAR